METRMQHIISPQEVMPNEPLVARYIVGCCGELCDLVCKEKNDFIG